jgi:hypothetical protein
MSSNSTGQQMAATDASDPGLGPSIMGTTWGLTVLAALCVGLRIFARAKIIKNIGLDDYLMLVAICLQFCWLGFVHAACSWGLGKPPQAFMADIDAFKKVQFFSWIAMSFGTSVSVMARVSIAVLLARIFSLKLLFKWFIITFTTLTALNGIVSIILSWLYVTPVQAVWDPTVTPTSQWDPRVSGYSAFVLQGRVIIPHAYDAISKQEKEILTYLHIKVFYAFTDLTFSVLPVIMVWKLHLPFRRKLGLIIVLSLGMVTLAAALTKIAIVVITTFNTSSGGGGTNYFQGIVYLTSSIEQAMVIIMGCTPVYPALAALDLGRLRSVSSSLVSVLRRKRSNSNFSSEKYDSYSHSAHQEGGLISKAPGSSVKPASVSTQ